MNREHHRWTSPALGREMELLVFGHTGARALVFPTSMGRFHDWEDRGMLGVMAESIESGFVQFVCVDSVDGESWYNKSIPPAERAARHTLYDRYVAAEVLPWSAARNPNPFVIAAGAGFGAYHAVNFAFRHPELVNRVLGMSGLYDIKQFTDGFSNDDVYFNNPCEFMLNEHEPERLEKLRKIDTILAVGHDDPARLNNFYFSGILWSKGIWHALRVWDGWAHDWPHWQKMIQLYLPGHD